MTRVVRRIAAAAAAMAFVAAMPLVCLCQPRPASADARDAHDCCAPSTGVSVADDGCCSRSAPSDQDSAVPMAPASVPAPLVAAAAVLPGSTFDRLAAARPLRLAAPSPPTVLRI
jgi:hypothetical protein